jgi:hypothetical protein
MILMLDLTVSDSLCCAWFYLVLVPVFGDRD